MISRKIYIRAAIHNQLKLYNRAAIHKQLRKMDTTAVRSSPADKRDALHACMQGHIMRTSPNTQSENNQTHLPY